MIKAFAFLFIGFFALIAFPICIGLAGGLFGLIVGLVGGAIGIVAGLFGAIIGAVAWVFKSIFHIFFGWGGDCNFHTGLGFNGYILTALVILILVISLKRKN